VFFAQNKERQEFNFISGSVFLNMLSHDHEVAEPKAGDFLIDNNLVFEVGGKNKSFSQVKNEKKAFLVLDDIEHGVAQKISLWLFGFLSVISVLVCHSRAGGNPES
jgi:hypothetical protein